MQRREERKHRPEVARIGQISGKWEAALQHTYCFTLQANYSLPVFIVYLYLMNISMFHGKTASTEILKTNITNGEQLITMVNKVPRESPHSAVKLWLNTRMFEINITFRFKEKSCVYSALWSHIFKLFIGIMRTRKLLSLKNEYLLSHQHLILGDATLRKKKNPPKYERTTKLRTQQ